MQSGDVLDDRYELLEQIGEGAFGAVWKARDARIQRQVAVKIMLPGVHTEKDVARFTREVALAGALNHPSIVTVHDFGRHQGPGRPQFYLVMELLNGEPLSEVLLRGTPPVPDALDWALQISEALATAHRAGVVHRDIKPANVMLQATGSVKVVDFGIARTDSADNGLTSTNVIMGTPAYMAPERFEGKGLDSRSDLYAFGCVLYELCTGRPPFRGSFYELIRQHGAVVPTSPSELRAGLPQEIDQLVLDLLAKEPASRPADAGQASARLRGIVRYAQRPTVPHSPTLRDGAPGSGPSDRTVALDPREAEGLRIMEKAMIDSAALLAEANRDAEAKRQAAQTLFEETRAKVAQATRDFETNLATRRAKADRDLAESERVSLESFQAAAVRREEADALFEETRTRAAQAALEFETNLAKRREQSERDLAARQAKAE
ncbi:serine/threonine-protein kinase, partial [Kitasatospora indigofera]|uniref:serine/threonine-protein kinase n=1 Tax=Kitasatospora indigofera TaxID=67307 RepID=UPI00368E209E